MPKRGEKNDNDWLGERKNARETKEERRLSNWAVGPARGARLRLFPRVKTTVTEPELLNGWTGPGSKISIVCQKKFFRNHRSDDVQGEWTGSVSKFLLDCAAEMRISFVIFTELQHSFDLISLYRFGNSFVSFVDRRARKEAEAPSVLAKFFCSNVWCYLVTFELLEVVITRLEMSLVFISFKEKYFCVTADIIVI